MSKFKSLIDRLTPDEHFLLFGWSDEKFRSLSEKMRGDTDSTAFFGGGRFSDGDLDESLQKKDAQVRELIQTQTVSGIINASNMILQERFDYQIMPAFEVGTRVMGGLHQSIMDAMGEAERIQHEYGLMAKNVVTSVGVGLMTAHRIRQEIRAAKAIRDTVTTVRRSRRALQALRVAWYIGSKFNPATLLISVGVELAAWGVYAGVKNATEDRARRLAMGNVAADMLNKQVLIDDYMAYRGTTPGGPDGVYDRFDDILSTQVGGGDLSRFGINYETMSNLSRTLRLNAPIADEHYNDYMAEALHMGNLFGADTNSLMLLASRINPDKEISSATRLFSQFFASVTGELASPQASQLELVQDLMSFTFQYAQGTKFNLDGGDTVAAIAAFMFGAYNKNIVQPMTQLMQSTDNTISQFMGNYSLNLMMEATGLTVTDMVRGVTSSPEVMNKYLDGLLYMAGIGANSFDEEGNLSEDKMTVLASLMIQNLGSSPRDVQAIIPALRRKSQGHRIGQVDVDDFESWRNQATSTLGGHPITRLADVAAQGERALTAAIHNNISLLSKIDDAIFEAYVNKVPGIINEVGRIVLTVDKLLNRGGVPEGDDNYRGEAYPVSPENLQHTRAASLATFHPKINAGSWDSRFNLFSNRSQDFQLRMYSLMAGDLGFRVTGAVGEDYRGISKTGTNYGADIVIGAAGSESPIIFPFRYGKVIYVGNRTNSRGVNSYGKSVVIELGNGLSISFSHLSRITVGMGKEVRYGDVVGYQGATGGAFGAHVDIEFRRGGRFEGNRMVGEIVTDADRIDELFRQFLPGNTEYTGTGMKEQVDSGNQSGYNSEYADEEESAVVIDMDLGAYGNNGQVVDEFLRLLAV